MKQGNQKNQILLPLLLIGAGLLMVIGVLIWVFTQQSQPASPASGSSVKIQRVSLQDAKAAFDAKQAVIIDVRDASTFQKGHIPGAINVPLGAIENWSGLPDKNQWLITYCT